MPNRLPSGRRLLLAALLVLGAGCVTTEGDEKATSSSGLSTAPRPWTTFYQRPALFVADEVFIEGPDDLSDHVAIVQNPLHIDYVTKTTEDGLLQELTIKEGRSRIEIRAQLDGWQVVAMKRMVILQRPGEVPVHLRGVGEAWWSLADGSAEQRSNQIEFRGNRGF